MPDNSLTVEQAFISYLLLNPEKIDNFSYVKPEYITNHSLRRIYETMIKYKNEYKNFDEVLLAQYANVDAEYIKQLSSNLCLLGEQYAAAICDNYCLKHVNQEIVNLSNKLRTNNILYSEYHTELSLLLNKYTPIRRNKANKICYDILKSDTHYNRRYSTGLKALDNIIDYIAGGELIVIAGRPGDGKTSLAIFISSHFKNVMFISLEMTIQSIAKRFYASKLNATIKELEDEELLDSYREKIQSIDCNFYVESGARTITDIIEVIDNMSNEVEIVVIDYLQLVEGLDAQTRVQEIGQITRLLKLKALEKNIPILLLSQLNRQYDSSSPKLSNLRDSGCIEQDADMVIFIIGGVSNDVLAETEIRVLKNRRGKIGSAVVVFNKETQRWS
ncbi:MAG: DnaB-like helicase C-terminal domain-containing protein [candidate division WOR-3 bacterium]